VYTVNNYIGKYIKYNLYVQPIYFTVHVQYCLHNLLLMQMLNIELGTVAIIVWANHYANSHSNYTLVPLKETSYQIRLWFIYLYSVLLYVSVYLLLYVCNFVSHVICICVSFCYMYLLFYVSVYLSLVIQNINIYLCSSPTFN